jgi:hypothetical protein
MAMRAVTLVVIATLVALVTLARPAEASARFEPPNVTNQSVPDAEATLKAWNPEVVITYKPGLETLPGGTDPSTVVVTSAEQTNLGVEFEPPLVTVSISPVIPDLVGLTLADAQRRVTAHGFRGVFEPTIAGLDWIVTSQRPAAVGERFRFNATIGMALVAPTLPPTSAVPVPTETDEGGGTLSTPVAVATAGGIGLLLLLLTLLGVRAARRARKVEIAGTEVVEMRITQAPLSGPTIVERPGGMSLSVRLESHMDAGVQTVQEVSQ